MTGLSRIRRDVSPCSAHHTQDGVRANNQTHNHQPSGAKGKDAQKHVSVKKVGEEKVRQIRMRLYRQLARSKSRAEGDVTTARKVTRNKEMRSSRAAEPVCKRDKTGWASWFQERYTVYHCDMRWEPGPNWQYPRDLYSWSRKAMLLERTGGDKWR
jgi:hypothetical protein